MKKRKRPNENSHILKLEECNFASNRFLFLNVLNSVRVRSSGKSQLSYNRVTPTKASHWKLPNFFSFFQTTSIKQEEKWKWRWWRQRRHCYHKICDRWAHKLCVHNFNSIFHVKLVKRCLYQKKRVPLNYCWIHKIRTSSKWRCSLEVADLPLELQLEHEVRAQVLIHCHGNKYKKVSRWKYSSSVAKYVFCSEKKIIEATNKNNIRFECDNNVYV